MQKRLCDGRSDAQRQIFISFLCIFYHELLRQFRLNSQGKMAQALKNEDKCIYRINRVRDWYCKFTATF